MSATTEITIRPQSTALVGAADLLTQVKIVQEVMAAVMKDGLHYGVIPGTKQPSLWKPGAEVLCAVFRIADSYRTEDLSADDYIRYRVTCIGTHQTTGIVMGEGLGECSSNEKKYKWVKAYDREWAGTPENRRRKVYGWDKTKRAEYEILQVRTEHADLANTILKMAAKRAKVAMTLNVTAASDIFTQDIEDIDERLRASGADEQDAPSGMSDDALAQLRSAMNTAKDKGQLAALLKTAMQAAREASDTVAHGALKAYAQTRALQLPDAPKVDDPAPEEKTVTGEVVE